MPTVLLPLPCLTPSITCLPLSVPSITLATVACFVWTIHCNVLILTHLIASFAAGAGADYGSRDVLADPELREGIKKYTHWPTIPQVFIAGEFVGGSDILMQMHQSGELRTKLEGTEGDKE